MSKYVKVLFGTKSGADNNLDYKIHELNEDKNFKRDEKDAKEQGGFNFSVDDKILRWLIRGDTIYDVEIPDDAIIIEVPSDACPHGVFRTNKIILHNGRKITDDIAMELYEKTNLPEKSYYKSLAGLAIRGHINTCMQLIRDKVRADNIQEVLDEINHFYKPTKESHNENDNLEVYSEVCEYLDEINSDLAISINCDKPPYVKKITDDNVINLTGETGSGKTQYSKKYDDNYIIIDTDNLFSDEKALKDYEKELRHIIISKYGDNLKDILINNFDEIYQIILDYFKNTNKTVVIDSALIRYMKDENLLKGEVIVIRTAIDTCYQRCLDRYDNKYPKSNSEEKWKYSERKKGMYKWYKKLNEFIKKVDEIN